MSNDNLLVLFRKYLQEHRTLGSSPLTIKTHNDRCGQFLAWLARKELVTIHDLSRDEIMEFAAELVEQGRRQITIKNYVQSISAFCNWLIDTGRLTKNPARKIKVRVPVRKPPSYSREQIIAMLSSCNLLRDRAIIITLLDTGLRVAELCSMRWPDAGNREFSIIGKGNKQRAVYIGEVTRAMIRAYVKHERGDHAGPLWQQFRLHGVTKSPSVTHQPLGPSGVHTMILRAATAAGVRQEIRRIVHSFRATFAKSYTIGGGDLESLRELLGHTTIAMAAHYAQLNDQELHVRKIEIDPLAVFLGPEMQHYLHADIELGQN